jgi:CDP-diacylglycerol---glycerol-3-phosphate 3-phosphatidyltransferase
VFDHLDGVVFLKSNQKVEYLKMTISLRKIPWFKNLPNQLTLGRIVAIPVLLLVYPFNTAFTDILSAVLFAIAGFTDILDGYIARKYEQETKMGALLDPVADKMLSGACLLLLASSHNLAAWICGFLLCRDIAVSGMRLIAAEGGHTIKVSSIGKVKTIAQDVGIFCLLMGSDYLDIPFRVTGMISIWIALFISLYSGYLYFREFLAITENNRVD